MSSNSTACPKEGVVRDYVSIKQKNADVSTIYACKAVGCGRITKCLPAAKWAAHIALDCCFTDTQSRKHVAANHKTKRTFPEFQQLGLAIEEQTFSQQIQSDPIERSLQSRSANNQRPTKLQKRIDDLSDH